MKQFQILRLVLIVPIILAGCNKKKDEKLPEVRNIIQKKKPSGWYKNLIGTWINHDSAGFTLIEIQDTSKVVYYNYWDRYKALKESDRSHWYYKSKAKMGYLGPWGMDSVIYIQTDRYRFDFIMRKDTLIEKDKTGLHEKFIKVKKEEIEKRNVGLTEEEKRIGFDEE